MVKLSELSVKRNRVCDDVDDLNRLYSEFLRDVVNSGDNITRFRDFDVTKDGVHRLFYETMGTDKRFIRLWKVVRTWLLLSHGQASVERGFSTNRKG